MMRSLFSGVAGLKSHQTRMDVVGNNISNINTVGFKSSRVTFADMLSQTQTGASTPSTTLGGTNPKQIGLGTAVASIDLIFSDGSPQSTGKNTDVALSGNGLFVLKSGSQYYYSRDGAFEFDANGNYVLPGSGYYVQGWNAIDGSLNTNAPPTDIIVPAGKTMSATATSSVNFTGNLNAGAPVITGITYTANSSGNPNDVINGGTITEVEYYDSDGTVIATASTDPSSSIPSITDERVDHVVITYTDIVDGTTSTQTTVTASTYAGTLAINDQYITSVNVDSSNVISAVLTLSDGTTQRVTTGYYQLGHSIPVTTSVTLYDSEGKTHAVTVLLDKKNATQAEIDALGPRTSANESTYDSALARYNNRWTSYIAPSVGERNPAVHYQTVEEDGSITNGYMNRITEAEFNALPAAEQAEYEDYVIYDEDGTTPLYYGKPGTIWFNEDGTLREAEGASLLLQYSQGNGSSDTSAAMDFAGLTQFNGSTTAFPTSNGNAFGVLQSVAIDGAGIITGTYTNGVRRFEAQIAVAQFINAAGLTKIGTSLYQESNNSGAANIKTVTNLGLTITPSALEMSNVDLASELADMIVTQRGFQSNSKMVTVADEMLETVVNMKR